MWFLSKLDPESATYNVPSVARLRGVLDEHALELSLHAIVRRHEVLRTTFVETATGLQQRVHEDPRVVLERIEPAEAPAEERAASARALLAVALGRPFDLESGPLLRVVLVRLGPEDQLLGFAIHHAVCDGWSYTVIYRELGLLYGAFAAQQASPLPELGIQYADFAAWQRSALEAGPLAAQDAYWRSKLEGASPSLDLPTDRPRPAIKRGRAERLDFVLPAALMTSVDEVARRDGASSFMFLLAALDVLLARWSGQRDVVTGTLVAGRARAEVEPLIGMFINTLALRTSLEGEPSFREVLRRVKETCLDAYANQDVPFERVIEGIRPPRDLSRTPVFQVMVTLQNTPRSDLAFPGLDARLEPLYFQGWGFDLYFFLFADEHGRMHASLEYDADLFDRATVERLVDQYRVLVAGAVAQPDGAAFSLPILGDAERARVLVEWNATRRAEPDRRCVHELFEAQAARTPHAVALDFEGALLTYAELDARANRLAHLLVEHGVRPGDVVALCMDRCLELVVAVYGILKAGAAYAPLDPGHPIARLLFTTSDLAAPVVLVTAATASRVAGSSAAVLVVDDARLAPHPATRLAVPADERRLAYVIYTSGSTGTPKGVMNVHSGLRNRLLWMQAEYRLTPADVVLQKTPYTFDVSVWELFWPLIVGARLVMARPDGHRDPAYLVDTIRSRGVTTLHFVPSMLGPFLEQDDSASCTSVRRVICSGEALPRALQDRFFERLGGSELHNLYGPTEASIDVSYWQCAAGDPHVDVPIGRPIWNTRLYVVDRAGQPQPVGVPGELLIAGVGLAVGYWNRAALTAATFVPDPFSGDPGARAYRTGDLVKWLPDGTLAYLGRLDHQIKLRGLRIELGEIESVLTATSGVHAAVVVAIEPVPGDKRLVAYVSPASLDVPTLEAALRSKVPDYMIPSAFVRLDALPLTSSGKVDRKALPAPDLGLGASTYVGPRNPLEQFLAGMFERVLRRDRVGVHDDFFAIGGDSLRVMHVVRDIRAVLQKNLRVRDFFEAPSVEMLAARIRAMVDDVDAPPPLVRSNHAGGSLLSLEQDFVLGWEAQREASGTWNHGLCIDLRGPLDRGRLRVAVELTLERQEALRQVFARRGSAWSTRLCTAADVPYETVDLTGQSDEQIAEWVATRSNSPFDLDDLPLVRFVLLERDLGEATLFVNWHESVNDATLSSLVMSEIAEHYVALGEQRAPNLPELPVRYVDYAAWARDWFSSRAGQADLEAVQRRLVGATPLVLGDRPIDGIITTRKVKEQFVLDAVPSTRFEELCRAEGVTRFMALAAICGIMLARLSKQEDFVFLTLVNFKHLRPELAHLAGRFTSPVPMRVSVADAASGTWRDLFARMRVAAQEALSSETAPLPLTLVYGSASPLDHPLGRVTLNVAGDVTPSPPRVAGDVTFVSRGVPGMTGARNHLFLFFATVGGRMIGHIGGAADRFDLATIQRISADLHELIVNLDPNARVS